MKAIFCKYREQSLQVLAQQQQDGKAVGHAKTKKELRARKAKVNPDVKKLRHRDGTLLSPEEQAQMNQFLTTMKQKFGIDFCFQKVKDDTIHGYSIVDHRNRIARKGSEVMDLQDLVDYNDYKLKQEQKAKAWRAKGYIDENQMHFYRQLCTPSVYIAKDYGPIVLITMKNGTKHWHRITDELWKWHQSGATPEEQENIDMQIAVYAFSEELYKAYFQQLSAEFVGKRYQQFVQASKYARIQCTYYHEWQIEFNYREGRRYHHEQYALDAEDVKSWRKTIDEPKARKLLKMQLVAKYLVRRDINSKCSKSYEQTVHGPLDDVSMVDVDFLRKTVVLHFTAFESVRRIFSHHIGFMDDNREYEVGDKEGYEESIRRNGRYSR